MVFSSLIFMFLFLPLCLICYFAVPGLKAKNMVLVVFSLVFYAWGEPVYLLLLLVSAAVNYGAGRWMGARREQGKPYRRVLVLAVVVNLLALGVFKYAGLFVSTLNQIPGLSLPVPQIALPIGISFYTFQAMSYVVDVYREQVGVQRSYLKFLLYISLFPQLIAGPIVRYSDIEAQLEERHASGEDMFYGLIRFSVGLGKKILIADHCYSVATQMLDGSFATATTVGTWLGILMFTFQIYFDFSGYSDMAIGLGRVFGFKYMENFNLPYTARSITDFWRRWHISLSSFFRDYVYIPLGGNRKHRWLNLLIVWSLTGLWHGASWNFLLWGLYFFVLLTVEKQILGYTKRWPRLLRQLLTMFLVILGWTIFYFTDFSRLVAAFQALFGFAGGGWINTQVRILLLNNLPLLLLCILGASSLPRAFGNLFGALCAHEAGKSLGRQRVYVAVSYVFCVAVLVLSTISLVGSGFSAFLYYRF
mgnify:FL=1